MALSVRLPILSWPSPQSRWRRRAGGYSQPPIAPPLSHRHAARRAKGAQMDGVRPTFTGRRFERQRPAAVGSSAAARVPRTSFSSARYTSAAFWRSSRGRRLSPVVYAVTTPSSAGWTSVRRWMGWRTVFGRHAGSRTGAPESSIRPLRSSPATTSCRRRSSSRRRASPTRPRVTLRSAVRDDVEVWAAAAGR